MINGLREGHSIAVRNAVKEITPDEREVIRYIIDRKLNLPARLVSVKRIYRNYLKILEIDSTQIPHKKVFALYRYICDELEKRGGVDSEWKIVKPYRRNLSINSIKVYRFPPLKEREKCEE